MKSQSVGGFQLIAFSIIFLGCLYLVAQPQTANALPPVFVEIADQAGLNHRNETWGWAVGDFDDDADLDLFLGNHPEQGVPDDAFPHAYRKTFTGC